MDRVRVIGLRNGARRGGSVSRRWMTTVAALVMVLVTACGSTVQVAGEQGLSALGEGDGLGLGPDGAVTETPGAAGGDDSSVGPAGRGGRGDSSTDGTSTTTPSAGSRPLRSDGSTPNQQKSGGARGSIPATGRGWDRERAYLGIPFQDTSASSAAIDAFGLNGFGLVDYKKVANAVVAYVNKQGGLFGRKLTPVYVEFPPVPNATGQAQCAAWTEDRPVFAVSNSFYDADALYACLAKARVPFSNGSISSIDQRVLDRYKPYARKMHVTSTTTLFPTWLDRLKARGYFSGWDTANGRAGGDPVKAGILCRDDHEALRNGCRDLERLLRDRGYAVAPPFHVSGNMDQTSNAVLKFRSAGVTHVFSQTTDILFFMQNAEQQQYWPRYALTSSNALNLLENNAPKKQLMGSLGVGFAPLIDVKRPPPLGPGRARCQKILRDANVRVDSSPISQFAAQAICDEILLYVHAARLGRGLAAGDILAGLSRITETYQAGNVFAVGLSATRFDEAAAVRDLGWNPSCSCFGFLSTRNWRS